MAKGRRPAAPTTWTTWTPGNANNRTNIHRRYVQIPSDQRELLERPDAWLAGDVPNVPPRVLEEVKACHARESGSCSRVERETLSSQPATPATPVQSERESFSSQPASPAHHEAVQAISKEVSVEADVEEDAEEEASDACLPWSPSPSAHFRSPVRPEAPAAGPSVPGRHSPEKLATRPAVKPIPQSVLLADFPPSSSLGSETGLDIEVPKAMTAVVESVNREAVAVLEPTPPSAQIIPSTLAEQTAPEQTHPAKKRRRMKPPGTFFASPDRVNQKHIPRLVPLKALSSGLPRSSSPVIESSPPIFKAPSGLATGKPPAAPSEEGGQLSATVAQSGIVPATSQLVSNRLSRNSAFDLPRNGPPSQDPFTAFKVAYPDYKGKLNDFLRGIMVLLKLQRDKALPGFLYDDFIRVFSGDYLKYIDTVDADQPALPTIKWYCENVSTPLYTKGVLAKDNVESIPKQYPDRVRAIQQGLETSETGAHSPAVPQAPTTTGAHKDIALKTRAAAPQTRVARHSNLTSAAAISPGVAVHNAELPSDAVQTTEGPQRVEEPRETAERPRSNIGVARSGTTRRPSLANEIESSLESLPEIKRTQTPQMTRIKKSATSALSNGMLSQLSNPESIPETIIKRKLTSRLSNGSSGGRPGAAFKRPRKTNEDPDARAARWKRYLINNVTQSSTLGGSSAS